MSPLDQAEPPAASGPQTILLVDDDPFILALYNTGLQKAAFTVLQAGNGQEALAICKQHPGPIHILVTDLLLPPKKLQLKEGQFAQPSLNGLEVMKQIMKLRPQIRVILMSAHSDEELKKVGVFKKGGIPFLQKPFKPEILLEKVFETLASPPKL